jgi:hypothetical protein
VGHIARLAERLKHSGQHVGRLRHSERCGEHVGFVDDLEQLVEDMGLVDHPEQLVEHLGLADELGQLVDRVRLLEHQLRYFETPSRASSRAKEVFKSICVQEVASAKKIPKRMTMPKELVMKAARLPFLQEGQQSG